MSLVTLPELGEVQIWLAPCQILGIWLSVAISVQLQLQLPTGIELGKNAGQKNVGQKKFKKNFCQKPLSLIKIVGQTNVESKQILGPKNLCIKIRII